MKKLFTSIAVACALIVAPVIIIGCSGGCTTSQQRQTVNTIASVGFAVDASYKGYLDLIVTGKLPTNSVPTVSKTYSTFQSAFNTALTLSVMNSNAPPSFELTKAAADVQSAITAAKAK